MKSNWTLPLAIMIIILITGCVYAQETSEDVSTLRGPYLGQKPPGLTPEVFAPGIVSTGLHDDYGPAITKDGNEIYFRIWGKPHAILWVVKRVEGKWREPEVAPFSGQYEDGGFIFSVDGSRIYFDSDRPLKNEGESKDTDIWIVDRTKDGWGEAINLDEPVNSTDDEYIGSVTADNTIYFTVRRRLADGKFSFVNYSSEWKNNAYSKPEKLPYPFNSDYFQIAPRFSPDETYAILTINGREDGIGQEDLYVTFKKADGTWTEPQNLGAQINSKSTDWFPSFSPDGKYLFFVSWRCTEEKNFRTKSLYEEKMMKFYTEPVYGHGADVFWVNTKIIEQLKPKELKESISVLVLLGEWFGDAYFPLKKEINQRGWRMERIGVDKEYRGCYNKKRDVVLQSDILIQDLDDFSGFDCLIIPSGPQWRKFNANSQVLQFVRDGHAAGLLIASFCVGNLTVKAAGLVDFSMGPDLFPAEVRKVKEHILLGPRGGGPPPGDGFESAPIKEICDAIAKEIEHKEEYEYFSMLKGPYLGQKPPGMTPEVFAPGIVSSEHQEHSSLSISPDGREMWWSRWCLPHDLDKYPQVILFIKYENGRWSQPKVAPFSGKYRDGGPAFSPDGNKIFFYSRRPLEEGTDEMHDNDIWYVKRTQDGWSRPHNIGLTVNSPYVDATPSLAGNGNLYFTSDRIQYDDQTGNSDIFVSEFVDGDYIQPKRLDAAINTPFARDSFPFIAPDESYIIFSRDSRRFDANGNIVSGNYVLMISFKDKAGKWLEAIDMGPHFVNTRFPSVSPDGKYLFFTKSTKGSHEDFYWVDAKVIDVLKPKELR